MAENVAIRLVQEDVVELGDETRWHNGSGRLREPGFSNLPGGEVVTSPARVDGAYRADGGLWLHDGTAIRGSHVLRFHRGSLVEVEGPDARFVSATLAEADLSRSNFRSADFSRADLRGAILKDADLRLARFFNANLQGADLTGANLTGVDLTGAQLTGARWIDGARVCGEGSIGACR